MRQPVWIAVPVLTVPALQPGVFLFISFSMLSHNNGVVVCFNEFTVELFHLVQFLEQRASMFSDISR